MPKLDITGCNGLWFLEICYQEQEKPKQELVQFHGEIIEQRERYYLRLIHEDAKYGEIFQNKAEILNCYGRTFNGVFYLFNVIGKSFPSLNHSRIQCSFEYFLLSNNKFSILENKPIMIDWLLLNKVVRLDTYDYLLLQSKNIFPFVVDEYCIEEENIKFVFLIDTRHNAKNDNLISPYLKVEIRKCCNKKSGNIIQESNCNNKFFKYYNWVIRILGYLSGENFFSVACYAFSQNERYTFFSNTIDNDFSEYKIKKMYNFSLDSYYLCKSYNNKNNIFKNLFALINKPQLLIQFYIMTNSFEFIKYITEFVKFIDVYTCNKSERNIEKLTKAEKKKLEQFCKENKISNQLYESMLYATSIKALKNRFILLYIMISKNSNMAFKNYEKIIKDMLEIRNKMSHDGVYDKEISDKEKNKFLNFADYMLEGIYYQIIFNDNIPEQFLENLEKHNIFS